MCSARCAIDFEYIAEFVGNSDYRYSTRASSVPESTEVLQELPATRVPCHRAVPMVELKRAANQPTSLPKAFIMNCLCDIEGFRTNSGEKEKTSTCGLR